MIIAFHNFKGGVGSTTHAGHTCALAKELGIKVVGVSVDFKQDLPRLLAGAEIPCVELDPKQETIDAELIVMDVQSHSVPPLWPTVWVVPILDGTSNRSAEVVSDRLHGPLIWLGNEGWTATVPAYLAEDVQLALPMPFSRAVCQAAEQEGIVWNIPELARSAGALALRASLTDVLRRAYVAAGVPLPPGLDPGPGLLGLELANAGSELAASPGDQDIDPCH